MRNPGMNTTLVKVKKKWPNRPLLMLQSPRSQIEDRHSLVLVIWS
jgi:hypothetical protein